MSTEANSINAATTGIVGNTGTGFTGTAVTAHNVIVGGATSSTLSNVDPGSDSGIPLISQGGSSDPIFGTALVPGGGTGAASFTAYAPICGGTTTTDPLQSADTGIGTSGFVLTSNGSSALPSFQAASGGGGGLVFIEAHTPSSLTFDVIFTAAGLTSYNNLLFIISGTQPVVGGEYITFSFSNDGGSTFTPYTTIVTEFFGSTVAAYTNAGQITPGLTSSSPGNGTSMQIWVGNPNEAGNLFQSVYGYGSGQDSTNGNCFFNMYAQQDVSGANAYRFFGNIVGVNTVGHFACYGIN